MVVLLTMLPLTAVLMVRLPPAPPSAVPLPVHTRRQLHEGCRASGFAIAQQGEISHLARADLRAGLRTIALEQWSGTGNLHDLRLGARRQSKVQPRGRANLNQEVGPRILLEPRLLCRQPVNRRRQVCHRVDSGRIRNHVVVDSRPRIGNGNRRIRNNSATGIGNDPGDVAAIIDLCP